MSSADAIIYVAGGAEVDRWRDECVRYCAARGYGIAAVVVDDLAGGRWPDVMQLVTQGRAEVVVVARSDQLPPDRAGRVEVAADYGRTAGQRRPTLHRGREADGPRRPSAGR